MKRGFAIVLSLIVLLIIAIFFAKPFFLKYENTDTYINKIGCRLYEFNEINFEVKGDIEKSDFEIFNDSKSIYKKGYQRSKIPIKYGWCRFKIYYNEILITSISHFKKNNWYTYNYNITVEEKGKEVIVNYSIEGPDSNFNQVKKMYKKSALGKTTVEYYDSKDSLYHIEFENN